MVRDVAHASTVSWLVVKVNGAILTMKWNYETSESAERRRFSPSSCRVSWTNEPVEKRLIAARLLIGAV
jgi:hypothetical protein